jgi:pyridoxamine 5'-phosphate oxidase
MKRNGALCRKLGLMDNFPTREEISAMRRSYGEIGLETLPPDPIEAFSLWLHDARSNPVVVEANAMVLSTADHLGKLTSRTVLLKGIEEDSFIFFTNYSSQKGQAIHSQPQVSLLFPWYPLERQVTITGNAEKISKEESEEYFESRPWESQIGAWASKQSQPLGSREELDERWKTAAEKWPKGTKVPMPDYWGGYKVIPTSIEFWQGRYSRLHDRLRFERASEFGTNSVHLTSEDKSEWVITRYYP